MSAAKLLPLPPAEPAIDWPKLLASRHLWNGIFPLGAELHRRRYHPLEHYTPDSDKRGDQLRFHKSERPIRLVLGGNQSGKSRCVAQEVAWWLHGCHPFQATPKAPRVYCISASYRTIQEGVWRHLESLIRRWEVKRVGPNISGYQMPGFVSLNSGAKVDFISGQGIGSAREKLQAAELDLAVVDEEVDQALWGELQARRLARGGRVIISATLFESDPWVLQLEDQAEAGNPEIELIRLSTRRAVERGHVRAEIVREIETTSSPEDVAVRIDGKSRRHQGLVYPTFGRDHIVEPREIPKDWTRFCAIDPGHDVFAVLWGAASPDDKVWIYREAYESAKDYLYMLGWIFDAERWERSEDVDNHPVWCPRPGKSEDIYLRLIDPSSFGSETSGVPKVGNLFAQCGLACTPAQNDVDLGIELVKRAMEPGLDGTPRLRVFRTCEKLVAELRYYRYKKPSLNPNADAKAPKPLKRKDHAADCLRYLFLHGIAHVEKETVIDEEYIQGVTMGMEERRREDLRRILRRGKHPTPALHPGGLGVNY